MRALISFFLFVFTALPLIAQQEPCAFDKVIDKQDPYVQQTENEIKMFLSSGAGKKMQATVKIIPVVVHVIHNNGAENISDAQIQSQIVVLNEDYRKKFSTNGFGNGVDTEVEFRLARITPDGQCTNGIVRVQSALTVHKSYQRSMLSDLSYWDSKRYLNIYVVNSISGGTILGYASFPGGPAHEDGIVMEHIAFGTTGTVIFPDDLGRTGTHEVGHWLGLYHTFNNGCGTDTCTGGDYVCDTPPAVNPNYNCPVVNSCSIDFPNVNDQVQNYMDYSSDVCKNMLTAGQKGRIMATLNTSRWNIWQYSNIVSTGTDSGYVSQPCRAIAGFVSNGQNICTGNSVLFTNVSQNNPTTYQWYFPGGTPSASTLVNPTVIYNTVGTYNVTLVAKNTVGKDSLVLINYINVSPPPIGLSLPYSEGFENSVFPSNGILISNIDKGITWERDTVAVAYAGKASAKINNLVNINYGQADEMMLPGLNMPSYGGIPYITFRWAYAQSNANFSDELIVLVSKDCGLNYTQVFYRTGANMITASAQTTPYIPDNSTVWKSAIINLNTYKTYTNLLVKITNVTDGGNNLYVDNLNIGDLALGVSSETSLKNIELYPNPVKANGVVYFTTPMNKCELEVFNLRGEIILQQQMLKGETSFALPAGIDKGIYFIRLRNGEQLTTKKLAVF